MPTVASTAGTGIPYATARRRSCRNRAAGQQSPVPRRRPANPPHHGWHTLCHPAPWEPSGCPIWHRVCHPFCETLSATCPNFRSGGIPYAIPYDTTVCAGQNRFAIGYAHLAYARAYTRASAGTLRHDTKWCSRCVHNLRWGGGSGGRRRRISSPDAALEKARLRRFASQPDLGPSPKPEPTTEPMPHRKRLASSSTPNCPERPIGPHRGTQGQQRASEATHGEGK